MFALVFMLLEPGNVISILISSDFLQMDTLVSDQNCVSLTEISYKQVLINWCFNIFADSISRVVLLVMGCRLIVYDSG